MADKPKRTRREMSQSGKNGDELTPHQQQFVDEYLRNGGNAADAYRKAGYLSRTDKLVYVNSSRLFHKPKVQKAINKALEERRIEAELTHGKITAGLMQEALGNGPDTNSSSRNTAWDKLAKHTGTYYPPEQKHYTVDQTTVGIDLEKTKDPEIQAALKAVAVKL